MRHRQPHADRGQMLKFALLFIALIGVGVAVTYMFTGRGDDPDAAAPADIFTVRKASFDMVIPASGELEAMNQVEIRNRVESNTTIKYIVDEGTRVKKGDLLVELTSDDIQTRLEDETLNVESAKSELEAAQAAVALQKSQNKSTEDKATLAVELAGLQLKNWEEGDEKIKRTDLETSLDSAQRNRDRLKQVLDNSDQLVKEGFISEDEHEQDRINFEESDADLRKAKLALNAYLEYQYKVDQKSKNSDVEQAQAELERTKQSDARTLAQKEADEANKEHQLAIRQARVADLKEQLTACTIKAPSDGLVVYGTSIGGNPWRRDQPLQIGQEVYSNQLLIVLPDTSQMVANVKVHESQSSQIKVGQKAAITIDAMNKLSFTGVVKSVGVLAEQAGFGGSIREYSVKILLDGDNKAGLKPSMRCKANILLGRVEDVFAIPVQAVFMDQRHAYVWTPDGANHYRKQDVKIGRNSETMIEIKEGLKDGDTVLLREPTASEKM